MEENKSPHIPQEHLDRLDNAVSAILKIRKRAIQEQRSALSIFKQEMRERRTRPTNE